MLSKQVIKTNTLYYNVYYFQDKIKYKELTTAKIFNSFISKAKKHYKRNIKDLMIELNNIDISNIRDNTDYSVHFEVLKNII